MNSNHQGIHNYFFLGYDSVDQSEFELIEF